MPVKAGVVRAGSRQTKRGAAETFTGVVFQDPVVVAEAPSRMGGSVVTFTPGARTAWHAHPVGQTLYCLSGIGRICFEGEKPQVLNPGDVVNIPPDTLHWHGASPDRLFAHLALSEAGEQGQGTAWGTHVSDGEYAGGGKQLRSVRGLAAGAPGFRTSPWRRRDLAARAQARSRPQGRTAAPFRRGCEYRRAAVAAFPD